jgi:cytochrome P450
MRFYSDPVAYMRYLYETYGDIVAWDRRPPQRVFVFGPDYNRQLLTDPDQFHAFVLATPAQPSTALYHLGATGLLAMNGELHRQQRRLIMPVFHKQRVATYRDTMVAITQAYLDRWRVGELHDIATEMRQLTLAISSKTLFDIAQTADNQIGEMIRQWLSLASSMTTVLFPFDLPGTPYRQLLGLSERIEAAMRALIEQKRANAAHQDDVLSTLIDARGEDGSFLNDAELVGQLAQLFAAGYETSANALTWTLFLLACHPTVLADLTDELVGVLRGDAPTVEQLDSLPLLDRVIKESLRLLPPAAYAARIAAVPSTIGPHPVAQGTKLYFSHYITHRLPDRYPEPQRFLPERWTTIRPSPYEYLPFSAGPRMCVGAAFAPMEIKIVLAMLLQRYRLSIPDGTIIQAQVRITLSPATGLPMVIAPRDRPVRAAQVRGNILTMVDLAL